MNEKHPLNYSIEIEQSMSFYCLMNHCRWLPGSAFSTTKPVDVNKKFIKNFHLPPKVLCVCLNNHKQDCYIDTLATVYPGQAITVMLSVNETALTTANLQATHYWKTENSITITAEINKNQVPPTTCRLLTELSYTDSI